MVFQFSGISALVHQWPLPYCDWAPHWQGSGFLSRYWGSIATMTWHCNGMLWCMSYNDIRREGNLALSTHFISFLPILSPLRNAAAFFSPAEIRCSAYPYEHTVYPLSCATTKTECWLSQFLSTIKSVYFMYIPSYMFLGWVPRWVPLYEQGSAQGFFLLKWSLSLPSSP